MDRMQKKIVKTQALARLAFLIFSTFGNIYIIKYVNTHVTMDKLSIAKLIIGLVSIVMIELTTKDRILDLLSHNLKIISVGYNLLEIVITLLVLIDPFTYLIAEAIFLSTISRSFLMIIKDMWNSVFQKRDKTKFDAVDTQTTYLGMIIGGGLGIIFSDIDLYTSVIILTTASVIAAPLNVYKIHISQKYLKEMQL